MVEKEEHDFNEHHPELGAGEVFLKNGTHADFQHCKFATKSQGRRAYTDSGNPLRNHYEPDLPPPVFPIFVEAWEKELNEKRGAVGYK